MSDQDIIKAYLDRNPTPQYLLHCKGRGCTPKKGQHLRKEGNVNTDQRIDDRDFKCTR